MQPNGVRINKFFEKFSDSKLGCKNAISTLLNLCTHYHAPFRVASSVDKVQKCEYTMGVLDKKCNSTGCKRAMRGRESHKYHDRQPTDLIR